MKGDGARALMCKNKEVLMIHRFRDGLEYYVLPGGHIEEGESAEQALLRELKEETSLDGKVIKKLNSFTAKDGRTHHIYECEYISGIPKLPADSEEAGRSSKDNIYIPMWVGVDKVSELTMWTEETKSVLITYLNQ